MTAPSSNWAQGLVVGHFRDRDGAERGIRALRDAGFPLDQIGVAMRDRSEQTELIEDTGTKAAEGAAAGAVSGGVLGGILGLLIGTGALVIPGVGPVVAGGALASALGITGATAAAGAGIGAATGGVLGALLGAGISEEEARYFDQRFREGGVLVTVSAGGLAAEARRVLEGSGADVGRDLVAGSAGTLWSGTTDRRQPNSVGRRSTDTRSRELGVGS
jgi:hypothetical protein